MIGNRRHVCIEHQKETGIELSIADVIFRAVTRPSGEIDFTLTTQILQGIRGSTEC